VLAVLGGLGAAVCFATSTLCSSRSSRLIGAQSVLAGVMLTGLVVVVPTLLVEGAPDGVGAPEVGWLLVSGGGNVVGLLLAYSALRVGKVGLVAPILSTEGALAALLAVFAGEPLAALTALLLALVAIGVALAAAAPDEPREASYDDRGRSVLLAVLGACAFGASLYATGRVSETVAVPWVLLPARLIGVLAVAVPLLARRRWRMTRQALPLVVVGGLCEVLGFASFAAGSRHGLAVAAVLASQFAAISGVAAFVLWRERLTRLQISGVAVVVVSVAALSVARS
jgi:drug/metabolite transporter (DMT)-like permease